MLYLCLFVAKQHDSLTPSGLTYLAAAGQSGAYSRPPAELSFALTRFTPLNSHEHFENAAGLSGFSKFCIGFLGSGSVFGEEMFVPFREHQKFRRGCCRLFIGCRSDVAPTSRLLSYRPAPAL